MKNTIVVVLQVKVFILNALWKRSVSVNFLKDKRIGNLPSWDKLFCSVGTVTEKVTPSPGPNLLELLRGEYLQQPFLARTV